MDGYRDADEVEEEVRAVGSGMDLFAHYSIGLPILMRIFSYLDVRTLGRVVLVNRTWYTHNKDRLTESHDAEKSLHVCDYLSYVVQSQIKEIKLKDQAYIAAKKNKALHSTLRRRWVESQKNASLFTADPLVEYNPTDNTIDYVNATVDLLRQYLKMQAARQQQKKRMGLNDKEEQDRRAFLNQLLKIMNNQLRDALLALSDILSGRTKWNSNFEIFELYYEQLKVLFPAKPSSSSAAPSPNRKRASPTAIISDPQARLIWQMRVGSDKYSCEFERFYEVVIEKEFLAITSEKMKQDLYYYFNYFLNFPRDNMVTTYKWEVLTRLFGPYHEFIENFSKYVLGSGFLGLINRHHAEEILENHPECVLMRFSRTYPTCLAFSFRKKDGKYDHYTNNPVWHGYPPFKGTRPKEETKSNIPIKEFLEKVFLRKGYDLLPLRVDGKSVTAKGTASKYAQVADPYLDTDRFESEDEGTADCLPAGRASSSTSNWGVYKNSASSPASSPSSSFSDQPGAYLADAEPSPASPPSSQQSSPWSSPLPKSFSPAGRRRATQPPLENHVADGFTPPAASAASPSSRRKAPQPLPENYVADSLTTPAPSSSLLPPASSFASVAPSSSPGATTSGPRGYQPSSPSSSSPRPSPYSDVSEYQKQGANEARSQQHQQRAGINSGRTPVVQTTFRDDVPSGNVDKNKRPPAHASTSPTPQPQPPRADVCFYLDGQSVKEELERNDPRSPGLGGGLGPSPNNSKSKRAESFQAENYLDDVVFVEEEEDDHAAATAHRDRSGRGAPAATPPTPATNAAFREYAAGQRATADASRRSHVATAAAAAAATATLTGTGTSSVYIGGDEELATANAGDSQQDSLILAALLGSPPAACVDRESERAKREKEEKERAREREREREKEKEMEMEMEKEKEKEKEREKERKKQERKERAKKEFEMNAYMYERDGDIHFADEDQAFVATSPTSAPNADAYVNPSAGGTNPVDFLGGGVGNNQQTKTKKAEELDEDLILAAILGVQPSATAAYGEKSDAKEREREKERTKDEQQRREKEERRREREERHKRKEERRRRKEEERLKAADQFEEAATAYGVNTSSTGGTGGAVSSGYFAEDDLLPRHEEEEEAAAPKRAQWDEYFLDEQRTDAKSEEERKKEGSGVARKIEWEETEDEKIMAALLGSRATDERESKGEEAAADPYAVPFADSAEAEEEGDDSEYERAKEKERERELEREKQLREEAEERIRKEKQRAEEEAEAEEEEQEREAVVRKKLEEKQRKDIKEERARLEEQTIAEARQKEGFVLPYTELTTTVKELLPRYVDRSKLESYLSDEEFGLVFGCPRHVFYTYKVWRQQQLKKNAGLF